MKSTKSFKQHFTSINKIVSRKVFPVLLCTLITASVSIPAAAADTGDDPYSRQDPGPGKQDITLVKPTNEWAGRVPLDYRVPKDYGGSTFEMIKYPFADSQGKSDVLQINYVNKATTTFGGISLQCALDKTVDVPTGSNIEFDVYYPKSAQGKYMRWRIATNGASADTYLRDYDYTNLNPDWIGNYKGETWLKSHHKITATTGSTSNITLELHGENSRSAETGTLIVANMKITEPDPNGVALSNVVNSENQSTVAPLKSKYNKANGLFTVGTLLDLGKVSDIGGRQYDLFVDGNALKAEPTHPRGPSWLTDINGQALSGATTTPGIAEYSFPDDEYKGVRDAGNYQLHGHVMAWYNQAPTWMTQIVPATLTQGYQGSPAFYGLGNNVNGQVKVSKDMARRVQYNHIVTVMRHFLTTDSKYGSSESRGIIPFHSWDILNEEVHESRHSENIPKDPNSWKDSLKNTNWLVAMSDDDITGDVSNHYVYLLFKYAHIAAPNAKMAAAYKANYASLPDYMKLDGNDNNGSIDKYITNTPPKLTYNDYGLATHTKARTVYNMVKELNTAWKSDPLYDGRPLIEDIGIQGHDSIGPTLASDNQYAIALYASLVDQGLLSGISYSELDLKLLPDAPGGGATAPAVLNVKQSDALGYEYALLYKAFTKFAPYIDHITNWGSAGSGWQGSYLLFDSQNNADAGYYGAMNPDRFIKGHSYLDSYFNGESQKVSDNSSIDLGDLGVYTRSNGLIKNAADVAKTTKTITAPAKDATTLTLPTMPDGYAVSIASSSNKAVIGLDGTIIPPAADTPVDLVLTIKKTADNTTANTIPISVIVPAKTADKTMLAAEIGKANVLTAGKYTAESWQALKDALVQANTVSSNPKALQGDVDSALAKLSGALKALVLKSGSDTVPIQVVVSSADSKGSYVASVPDVSSVTGTTNCEFTLGSIKIEIPASILKAAGPAGTLKLSADKTSTDVAAKIAALAPANSVVRKFDLNLTGASGAIHELGQPVTVTVTLSADEIAQLKKITPVLYYYDSSTNKLVDMGAKFDLNQGTVTFTTTHFSTYLIAGTTTQANPHTGSSTAGNSPLVICGCLAMLILATSLIYRRFSSRGIKG